MWSSFLFLAFAFIQASLALSTDGQFPLGSISRTPLLGGVTLYPIDGVPPLDVQFFQSQSPDFRTPHILVLRYRERLDVVVYADNYLRVQNPIQFSTQFSISTSTWSLTSQSSMGYLLTVENNILTVIYDKLVRKEDECLRTFLRVFDIKKQQEVFPETPFFGEKNYCREPSFPLSVSRSYANELGSVIVATVLRKGVQEPRHTVITRSWLVWPPAYIKPEGHDFLQWFGNTLDSKLQSVWVDFDRDRDRSKKISVVAVTTDNSNNRLVSVQTVPVDGEPQSYYKPAELFKKPGDYSLQPFSLYSGNREKTYFFSLVRRNFNVSLAVSANRNYDNRMEFSTWELTVPVIKNVTGFCLNRVTPAIYVAWTDSAATGKFFVDVEQLAGYEISSYPLDLGAEYRVKRLLQYAPGPAAMIAVLEMENPKAIMFAKVYFSKLKIRNN